MENFTGGYLCAAAASGLCRLNFPVGPAQRAGRGTGKTGVPDGGIGTVLQTASRTAAR